MPERRRHRRSVRMPGHDYGQAGAYFITVCTHGRECTLGKVTGATVKMSPSGEITIEEWNRTADLRSRIRLDAFVVMPNHVHGIIVISDGGGRGTLQRVPTIERFGSSTSDSIPTIVRLFKSATTKRINEWQGTPGNPVWQRGYFEHVIRNAGELQTIRDYILSNPSRWSLDQENPARQGADEFDSWLKDCTSH